MSPLGNLVFDLIGAAAWGLITRDSRAACVFLITILILDVVMGKFS